MLRDYITVHADAIRGFQQPAINWAYNQNGALKANIQYAKDCGALYGIMNFDPMTRDDVTNYFTQDMYTGFIATMLWGNKNRGFHKVVNIPQKEVVRSLNNVLSILEQGNIREAYCSMCRDGKYHLEQIDYAFFTKLLFFMSKAFSPHISFRPLILDSHMIVAHCALLLDEFQNGHHLYKWRNNYGLVWYKASSTCAADVYMDYIERMHNIATSINTESETLESFLFANQPGNQLSFIYQDVYNHRNLLQ